MCVCVSNHAELSGIDGALCGTGPGTIDEEMLGLRFNPEGLQGTYRAPQHPPDGFPVQTNAGPCSLPLPPGADGAQECTGYGTNNDTRLRDVDPMESG